MKHRKIVKASEGGVFREELAVGGYLEVQMQFFGGTGCRWYDSFYTSNKIGHFFIEISLNLIFYLFFL